MIGKKVANPQGGTGKAARVSGLLEYVADPGGKEKCIHSYSDGFLSDELAVQIAEMTALAQEATRSADPINHYVLSWQEGEQPTPAQVDAAVQIFMKELGLEGHQVFAGLHADTDNLHLHIVVNRVHPDTLKPTRINNGFDIEAIHRAVAQIEQAQGWNREEHGRYVVSDSGDVALAIPIAEKPKQPDQTKIDQENRTGEKSAERIAIEDAAPLIKAALSWPQLHAALAEQGIRYEKIGSGAKIYIGDIAIKASSADRGASLAQLEKRLGLFEPVLTHSVFIQHTIVPRHERQNPVDQSPAIPGGFIPHRLPDQPGRRFAPHGAPGSIATASVHTLSERRLAGRQQMERGQAGHSGLLPAAVRGDRQPDAGLRRLDGAGGGLGTRDASRPLKAARAIHPLAVDYLAAKAVAVTARRLATIAVQTRQGAERAALLQAHRDARTAQFKANEKGAKGSGKGTGAARNALRSLVAGQHAGARADLQERHQGERAALREQHPVFPDVETWHRQRGQPDQAAQWRARGQTRATITGDRAVLPVPLDIRAYQAKVVGATVHYALKGDATRRTAFVDQGRTISIGHWRNNTDATNAALQLAATKWPYGIAVQGPPAYLQQCVELAVAHGYKILNPELQEALALAREQARPVAVPVARAPAVASPATEPIGAGVPEADRQDALSVLAASAPRDTPWRIDTPRVGQHYEGRIEYITDTHILQRGEGFSVIAHDIRKLQDPAAINRQIDNGELKIGGQLSVRYGHSSGVVEHRPPEPRAVPRAVPQQIRGPRHEPER